MILDRDPVRVTIFSANSRILVFTAAFPGQGGEGHYNEQPKEYWIIKFMKYGWRQDLDKTVALRNARESGGVLFYYWENLIVFRR